MEILNSKSTGRRSPLFGGKTIFDEEEDFPIITRFNRGSQPEINRNSQPEPVAEGFPTITRFNSGVQTDITAQIDTTEQTNGDAGEFPTIIRFNRGEQPTTRPPVGRSNDSIYPSITSFAERLGVRENSGETGGAPNAEGFSGLYQFGTARLADIGVYSPAVGEDLEANQWRGVFNIPRFPEVKTHADFLANREAQNMAFRMHIEGIDGVIAETSSMNNMDVNGLRAVAHLGGIRGMQRFVQDGANPADSNGTTLQDYYNSFSSSEIGQQIADAPEGSLDVISEDLPPNRVETLLRRSPLPGASTLADMVSNDALNVYATVGAHGKASLADAIGGGFRMARELLDVSGRRFEQYGLSRVINLISAPLAITNVGLNIAGLRPIPTISMFTQPIAEWVARKAGYEGPTHRVADPVSGALEATEQVMGFMERYTHAFADGLRSDFPQRGRYALGPQSTLEYFDPVNVFRTFGHAAPTTAALLGVSMMAPVAVALPIMAAVEGGHYLEEVDEIERRTGQQFDDEQVLLGALAVGSFNAVLERHSLGKLANSMVPGTLGFRNRLFRWLIATGMEGTTETFQEGSAIVTGRIQELGISNLSFTMADAERLGQAFYGGIIVAGGLSMMGTQINQVLGEPITTEYSGTVYDANGVPDTRIRVISAAHPKAFQIISIDEVIADPKLQPPVGWRRQSAIDQAVVSMPGMTLEMAEVGMRVTDQRAALMGVSTDELLAARLAYYTHGKRIEKDDLLSFVSLGAELTPLMEEKWQVAVNALSSGADPELVRATTGWFIPELDIEGGPRFEVSGAISGFVGQGDRGIPRGAHRLNLLKQDHENGVEGTYYMLSDIVEGEIFDLYPKIKDARVYYSPPSSGVLGSFNPVTSDFTILAPEDVDIRNTASSMRRDIEDAVGASAEDVVGGSLPVTEDIAVLKTIRHEVQHWIQEKAGWSPGTSSTYLARQFNLTSVDAAVEMAWFSVGEMEARDSTIRDYLVGVGVDISHIPPMISREVPKGKSFLHLAPTSAYVKSLMALKVATEAHLNKLTKSELIFDVAGPLTVAEYRAIHDPQRAEIREAEDKLRLIRETLNTVAMDEARAGAYFIKREQAALTELSRLPGSNELNQIFGTGNLGRAFGAISFLDDGRAIIKGFSAANFTTYLHEQWHMLLQTLTPEEDATLRTVLGVTGEWTSRKNAEKFVSFAQKYLLDAESDNPAMAAIMGQTRKWMMDIYAAATAMGMDSDVSGVEMTPEIREVYDKLFAREFVDINPDDPTGVAFIWDKVIGYLDLESRFKRIGGARTGAALKQRFSVEDYYINTVGKEALRGIVRIFRQPFQRLTPEMREKMMRVIYTAESGMATEKYLKTGSDPQIKAALQIFTDMTTRLNDELVRLGGNPNIFRERLMAKVESQLEELEAKKMRNRRVLLKNATWDPADEARLKELQRTLDFLTTLNALPLPTQAWLESTFDKDPRQTMRWLKEFQHRNRTQEEFTIFSLVRSGKLDPKEIEIHRIIEAFTRVRGGEIALLKIKQIAVRENLMRPILKGASKSSAGRWFPVPKEAPIFKGYEVRRPLYEWLSAQTAPTNRGLAWLHNIMVISKMGAFADPILMPLYNTQQMAMQGALFTPTFPKNLALAVKDVYQASDLYRKVSLLGGFSQPYTSPLKSTRREYGRIYEGLVPSGTNAVFKDLARSGMGKALVVPGVPIRIGAMYYNTAHAMAWQFDRITRMTSIRYLMQRGHTVEEAVRLTATASGDYAAIPEGTKRKADYLLFTPSFKVAMGKFFSAAIEGTAATYMGRATVEQKAMGKVVINTLLMMTAIDMIMMGLDFEREKFGQRYTRPTKSLLGPKDLVMSWSGPYNMFLKYQRRWEETGAPDNDQLRILSFIEMNKWELQPLIRIGSEVWANRAMDGGVVWDTSAPEGVRLYQMAYYAATHTFDLFRIMSNAAEFGGMTGMADDLYAGEVFGGVGRDNLKAMLTEDFGANVGTFSSAVLSRVAFPYLRDLPPVEYDKRLRNMEAVYFDLVDPEGEIRRGGITNIEELKAYVEETQRTVYPWWKRRYDALVEEAYRELIPGDPGLSEAHPGPDGWRPRVE